MISIILYYFLQQLINNEVVNFTWQTIIHQFENDRVSEKFLCHNLCTLYGIHRVPSNMQMRERLDGLDLARICAATKAIIERLQRGKVLESWKFLDQSYLAPLDGTCFFLPLSFIAIIVVRNTIEEET